MSQMNTPDLQISSTVTAAASVMPTKPCPHAISKPNAAYLAATRKIDISGLPFGSMHDFISDGEIKVRFSTPMEKRGPVPDGWATWSSPPFSESSTPDVLITGEQTSLTMDLSKPVAIFGFDLEPNGFQTFAYTADFYREGQLIDSIMRNVDGNAGARLFARAGEPIDRVIVSGPDAFAIAQVRLQEVLQAQQRAMMLFGTLMLLLVVPPFLL